MPQPAPPLHPHLQRRYPQARASSPWGRRLLVALLATTLVACSATRLAYNFLDWAIERRIQRYITLDHDQRLQTRAAIRDFHQWHRTTQLPIYADYLTELQQRLQSHDPLTGAAIHAETDRLQLWLDDIIHRVQPDMAAVLSTLSDAQVQELLQSVTREREKFIDEHVNITDRKRTAEREKKFIRYLTHWTGALNRAQKTRIHQWSQVYEAHEALSAEQQVVWQETLAALLAQRQNPDALLQGLQSLMLHRTDDWHPELEAIMDRNQQRTYDLLAKLLNNLTDRQQRRLQQRLSHYADTARQLASAKGVPEEEPETELHLPEEDELPEE